MTGGNGAEVDADDRSRAFRSQVEIVQTVPRSVHAACPLDIDTVSRVEHVLWIGGPPGAGKTTVARLLARKHGLRLYSSDTRTWDHRDRAFASGVEAAVRWEALAPEERWDSEPVDLLRMSLHHERGQMVLDDLSALPSTPLVVAEGTCLPTAAASSQLHHAVWLVPTTEFQLSNLAARGLEKGTLEMYQLLTEVVAEEARAHGLPTVCVDASASVVSVLQAVEEAFHQALATGPRAVTTTERRRLLREINQCVVAQVRGFRGRPWSVGGPDAVVQSFVCECADESCTVEISCTVGEAAAKPVVAHPDEKG